MYSGFITNFIMKFKLEIAISLLFLMVNFQMSEALNVDSLKQIILKNTNDSNHVKALEALSEEVYLRFPDSAIANMLAAKAISEKINFNDGIAISYGWLAYLYEQKGSIEKAQEYYEKSLTLYKRLGNKMQVATCLNNIAAIYKDRGMINEALDYNYKSLAIRKQINDTDGISTSYNNLGLILSSQGKIPEALEYYSKALKNYELNNDLSGISTALQNIAFVYKAQHQYDEALSYFKRALAINQKANDKYGLGYSLNAMGGVFEELNNFDSALYYYDKALKVRTEIADKQGFFYTLKNIGIVNFKIGKTLEAKSDLEKCLTGFEELNDKWGLSIVTNKLGELYIKEDLAKAEKLLTQSLQLAKELGYPAEIRNAAANLQLLYRKKSDWKNALLMNDLYVTMRDSIMNDENRKVSIKTQFRYEYEKREALIKSKQEKKDAIASVEINKQLIIRNAIAAGFFSLVIFSIVVYRQRNKISKARKRSDELLLNILPEEVAEELKEKGSADAKQFDEVTVLFTDFKGFTQLSEKLSPQELVAEINECFSAFDHIMQKHGVEKIKTIGDAYMAVGGLPTPNKTHAEDVVRAALEIQQLMQAPADHFEAEESQRVEQVAPLGRFRGAVRIGVHTGPVVAGIVGVKKFAYDIWGDTVNTASRMESSGEVGRVNISGSTYELVKDKFNCIHRGKITAKGKGEIDMYFVEKG
jgi:class 3 adenylate cyclase/Tfp pilus assembly protein PilF